MDAKSCRCGHAGEGPHPCHGDGYACRKPATQRFYSTGRPFSLAGMQMKMSMADTWACDECWAAFRAPPSEDRGQLLSLPVDSCEDERH